LAPPSGSFCLLVFGLRTHRALKITSFPLVSTVTRLASISAARRTPLRYCVWFPQVRPRLDLDWVV